MGKTKQRQKDQQPLHSRLHHQGRDKKKARGFDAPRPAHFKRLSPESALNYIFQL
jgi:hypothetical protein